MNRYRRLHCGIFLLAFMLSISIILWFTIFNHAPSDVHRLIFSLSPNDGIFFHEMLLNIFLYVPFGISAPFVLREIKGLHLKGFFFLSKATIGFAFLLSICVEVVQLCTGCGTAQFTDLICNSVGAAVGSLAFCLARYFSRKFFIN